MNMVPVTSSNLRSVGYDPQSRTLSIQFHSSGLYHYHNVPLHVYQGLMDAASKGQYHHRFIRDQYPFTR